MWNCLRWAGRSTFPADNTDPDREVFLSLKLKLILAAGLTACTIILYNFTPLGELVDLNRLLEEKNELLVRIRAHRLPGAVIFVLAYIAVVGLSIPGATVMTLLGGFFFGPVLGVLLVNIGATAGAMVIFFIARFFLGQDIQEKYRDQLARLNRELEANGKHYLLTLRLIPVFPFFLINLLAGFTAIPGWTFFWTTALGIIPGSFVYSYLGSTGANAGASGSFGIQITVALVLLGLLSLMPAVVKKIRRRRHEQDDS